MAYLTSVHLVVHEKNWEKSMKSMAIVKCSCLHRFRFNFCIQPTGIRIRIRIRIHRHIHMSNIHTFAMTQWQKQSFSKHKYTSQYSLPDLSEQNRHLLEQRWQRPIKKIEREWNKSHHCSRYKWWNAAFIEKIHYNTLHCIGSGGIHISIWYTNVDIFKSATEISSHTGKVFNLRISCVARQCVFSIISIAYTCDYARCTMYDWERDATSDTQWTR